ncbi:hypothetical protein ADU59_17355 [Pararhizobium polonicum]|uniref:Uncharacterized protein n=2 Tax=Pararhizobium polonicum TaxID=1612624 RepID=A0A1C7NZM2_9HYPH|nr:hypothetical protein ADU59_17355 [Pararhizobium polonicum]
MPMDLISALALSLAIGFSWHRFRQIFSQATDRTVLLSPATTLASTVNLSAMAMAFSGNSPGIGGTIVALGLLFAVAGDRSRLGSPARLTLAVACLLAHAGLSGSF